MTKQTEIELQQASCTAFRYPCSGCSTETLRDLEVAEIYARIRHEQRLRNRRRLLLNVIRLWPVAIGMLLACFAPEIRALLVPYRPWGMWIVFPFVALARRPELQFNTTLSGVIPVFMLYAQFPIEGLLARMALKKRVTLKGVARHVFFMHFLTGMELCMVSGILWQAVAH